LFGSRNSRNKGHANIKGFTVKGLGWSQVYGQTTYKRSHLYSTPSINSCN